MDLGGFHHSCEIVTSPLLFFTRVHHLHSLVSVVSYWESFVSSYMSTSTRARAGPSITLLMFSLARASASRSPRPHTDWSSRIAAGEAEREEETGEAEERRWTAPGEGKKRRRAAKEVSRSVRGGWLFNSVTRACLWVGMYSGR